MWKHHMTFANFGGNFKSICQVVAIQNRLQIHEKSFQKNKVQEKANLAIKSTDKELFHRESIQVQ